MGRHEPRDSGDVRVGIEGTGCAPDGNPRFAETPDAPGPLAVDRPVLGGDGEALMRPQPCVHFRNKTDKLDAAVNAVESESIEVARTSCHVTWF